jgi:protein SCO1/2
MNTESESGRKTSTSAPGQDSSDEGIAPSPLVDRAAALRAGRTPISPKFILWMIVAFAVLGLGGGLLQHFEGNLGLPTSATIPFTDKTTTTVPDKTQSTVPMSEFLGRRDIGTAAAPGFSLQDQTGHQWSLAGAKGKVVVLAFYDANCNDICPVLGAEIKKAHDLLGSNAGKVDFVIVNTDPNTLIDSPSPPALSVPGLLATPDVRFVNGPLDSLNAVWTQYGISIRVGANTNVVTHNNLMYFIDRAGQLRVQIDPFATENSVGVVSLDLKDIQRFARGITQVADSLIK